MPHHPADTVEDEPQAIGERSGLKVEAAVGDMRALLAVAVDDAKARDAGSRIDAEDAGQRGWPTKKINNSSPKGEPGSLR